MRYGRLLMLVGVLMGACEVQAYEPIIAASPLRARVAPGSQIYVDVAMGGVPIEGTRPTVSGIAYDPAGRMYRLRHKPMDEYFFQHLAFNLTPHSPLGKYTIHVTIERDTSAYGLPVIVEVAPIRP